MICSCHKIFPVLPESEKFESSSLKTSCPGHLFAPINISVHSQDFVNSFWNWVYDCVEYSCIRLPWLFVSQICDSARERERGERERKKERERERGREERESQFENIRFSI